MVQLIFFCMLAAVLSLNTFALDLNAETQLQKALHRIKELEMQARFNSVNEEQKLRACNERVELNENSLKMK
uniref:Uncharacterized protein n=1 Tax=Panagrolaimus sp. ES5 TaxID=591445 RepID=A0AC34FGH6_9BILA